MKALVRTKILSLIWIKLAIQQLISILNDRLTRNVMTYPQGGSTGTKWDLVNFYWLPTPNDHSFHPGPVLPPSGDAFKREDYVSFWIKI